MFLYYLDESGTGLGRKQTPYFILCAVSIPMGQWNQVNHRVNQLKRNLIPWAKPEDWEIKGRDIRRGEKFFASQKWSERTNAIFSIASLIAELPSRFIAVQVDKKNLPESIQSDSDLYRLAFWRLLDELNTQLITQKESGMLLVDARSDMHSSVQDRRLLDAYLDWTLSTGAKVSQFVDLPWFGFSAFYVGLQLADFIAYFIDVLGNERPANRQPGFQKTGPGHTRNETLERAYNLMRTKIKLISIP